MGLSGAVTSVLAATPVICFGLVSGLAAPLARRTGEERALLGAIIVLVAGLVARAVAPGALLFPGTIAASGGIAIMNVLLSSLIKRRWPERAGFLIGLYLGHKTLDVLYGPGGSLVLLLLWVQYSAQVFFLGAAVTGELARRRGHAIEPNERGVRVLIEEGM